MLVEVLPRIQAIYASTINLLINLCDLNRILLRVFADQV